MHEEQLISINVTKNEIRKMKRSKKDLIIILIMGFICIVLFSALSVLNLEYWGNKSIEKLADGMLLVTALFTGISLGQAKHWAKLYKINSEVVDENCDS